MVVKVKFSSQCIIVEVTSEISSHSFSTSASVFKFILFKFTSFLFEILLTSEANDHRVRCLEPWALLKISILFYI